MSIAIITYVRLNSHIRATKIEDPTQTHNNRISWVSIIIIDNYLGTWHYEKYRSQLRPTASATASAGCNISHNAMCLRNYPLNKILIYAKINFSCRTVTFFANEILLTVVSIQLKGIIFLKFKFVFIKFGI